MLLVMQTSAEFTELMMCVQERAPQNLTEKLLSDKRFHGKVSEFKAKAGVTLPEAVDWRTGGAVTKIKDQVSGILWTRNATILNSNGNTPSLY